MGRGYSPSVYRTVQMSNAQLKACNRCEQEAREAVYLKHDTHMSVQRSNEVRQSHEQDTCCGDKHQNYPSLAIVTSPGQVWQMHYSPCDAMKHGTLFCELYKPWVGCKTGGRMR